MTNLSLILLKHRPAQIVARLPMANRPDRNRSNTLNTVLGGGNRMQKTKCAALSEREIARSYVGMEVVLARALLVERAEQSTVRLTEGGAFQAS